MALIPGVQELLPQVVAWRRDIHAHPELGFQEVRTSGIVRGQLAAFGLEVLTDFCPAKTAVIGVLRTGLPGPVVALRADMDALPMQDEKDVPYRSQNPGVCHACGHDAHTAALLGVAQYFSQHPQGLCGTLKFVFQPAEEGPAPGGAKAIVESGILDDVDYMLGAHQASAAGPGWVMVKYGQACASGDFFDITIHGKGTHGASPDCGNDVIVTAAQLVNALQTIVSRRLDPLQPAVLSVCSLQAGEPGTKNVLPSKAVLSGTVRTFDEGVREAVFGHLQAMTEHVCALNGCTGQVDRQPMFPSLSNDKLVTDVVLAAAQQVAGEDRVIVVEQPSTGSEDFAWYAGRIPSSFYMFGAAKAQEGGAVYGGHHPKFDLDENALPTTMSVMIEGARRLLQLPVRDKKA